MDQYTIWSTDSNGNYLSNSIVVSGFDSRVTSLESSFQQDLNGDGTISTAAATIAASNAVNAGQSGMTFENQTSAFNLPHFIAEKAFGGWHFNSSSQLGAVEVREPDGFLINNAGSQLLAEILKQMQQIPAFATMDGAAIGHHDIAPTQIFDLHTAYLTGH